MNQPYTLYLMWISYFSGKMQAYLRYKEVPHVCEELKWRGMLNVLYPNTGLMKVPVVRTPEGEWLADTTPMIDWFEQRFAAGPVIPQDPLQAFFSRLLEDYADEWLWRPALHYRWSYAEDAQALSRRFAHTFLSDQPGPKAITALLARSRQKRIFVRGDGVTPETREHVESIYLNTLNRLEAIFRTQPFLLGGKPSLADFGFFASMFRHFSQDPTPSLIMQARAPAVFEWVGRLWNARHSTTRGDWHAPGTLPAGWLPILKDAGEAYLPYLHANARAFREGRKHFDFEVQGVTYRRLPVVEYRVWCREQLQKHYAAVPDAARAGVDSLLQASSCLDPLLRDGRIESGLYAEVTPPVCKPRTVGFGEKLSRYFT
ncbi:MAG: glutathione S-transferase C-terminal domain-containing protein, partial [Nevskiales bacterium]